jgi:NAD-dependent SIR2 family protein deacetylase
MKDRPLDEPLSKFNAQDRVDFPNLSSEIMQIKRQYNNGKLVLVLGAGVSKGSNLPTWDDLLVNIMVDCFDPSITREEAKAIAIAYLKDTNNPLVSARFIKKLYLEEYNKGGNPKAKITFNEKIRSIIYKDKSAIDLENNSTLNAVFEICKNNKIKHIITYNYDDLLEQKMHQESMLFKTISGKYQPINDDDFIRIYHVHGYAPLNDDLIFDNRVLEEQDYHWQYSDTYNWQNLTQLMAFRDYTCLFIGTSLIDPNQRRLLDIVSKQCDEGDQPMHYWIGKVGDNVNPFSKDDMIKHPEIFEHYNNTIKYAKINDFKTLNIRPIFLNSHKEVAQKVLEIL